MPRHEDVAKLVLVYRQWFPKLEIQIMKFDVARAFRQKLISAGAFGPFRFDYVGTLAWIKHLYLGMQQHRQCMRRRVERFTRHITLVECISLEQNCRSLDTKATMS